MIEIQATLKQTDDPMINFLISSNNFMDLEGEIVSKQAWINAVKEMDETGNYGIVDWWHTKITSNGQSLPLRIGEVMKSVIVPYGRGAFLLEAFKYDSPEIARGFAGKALKVSVEFQYLKQSKQNGVYHAVTLVRRSILPAHAPANPLTLVS